MRQRIIDDVMALQRGYEQYDRDGGTAQWMRRLVEEVYELAAALIGVHEHTPEWELRQIASIVLNWLDMRADRGLGEYADKADAGASAAPAVYRGGGRDAR